MFLLPTARSLSALLVIIAAAPLSAQDTNWAKKMFDRHEVKFGSVAKNADVVFKFQVKNIYTEAIEVSSLSTSCGCISWQDKAPMTIPSGETKELTVRLDTIRFEGDRHVTAFANLREPSRGSTARMSIPIDGRIRQDVVLQTNNLNFGDVEMGKAMQIRMNVSYTGGKSDWAITAAKVTNPHLKTQVTETSRSGGTAKYDILVTLDSQAPASKLHDRMLIVSNEAGDAGYSVTIDAHVEPEIAIADAQFGQVFPGHPKTVNVVAHGRKPFKIEKVERAKQDESFKLKVPDSVARVHTIPLTLTPSTEHGLFEEEFSATIAGRQEPIKFKAKGRVMDQSVTTTEPAPAAKP